MTDTLDNLGLQYYICVAQNVRLFKFIFNNFVVKKGKPGKGREATEMGRWSPLKICKQINIHNCLVQ